MLIFLIVIALLMVVGIIMWYAKTVVVESRLRPVEACWFYQSGDEKVGPVLAAEIIAAIGAGELAQEVAVWSSQLAEWTPAAEVAEIAQLLPRDGYSALAPQSAAGSRDDFERELQLFAADLASTPQEVKARIVLQDHTGRSCAKVLARRVGVAIEQIMQWSA